MRLADLREPAAAGSAFEEAGEEVIGPAGTLGADALILRHDARPRILLAG